MDNANVETVPSNGKTAKIIHNAYDYLKDRQLSEGKVGYAVHAYMSAMD